MTPKIIHYVWVGGAPKPPIVLKCIESWKKFCPDWEIKEWGDDILSEIDNKYVCEAYKNRKYAFVADWLRLHVLYKYGGFYLDTDMEILKPIDDFIANEFTMGLVGRNGKVYINGCFIGSVKGCEIIRELLSLYDDIPFVKSNGELDQKTNVVRMAEYFAERWNVRPKNALIKIVLQPGYVLYPHDFFLSREGYTYHHYCASWIDAWVRKVWIKIGRFKILRLKRRVNSENTPIDLLPGEVELFRIGFGRRKKILLIRNKC